MEVEHALVNVGKLVGPVGQDDLVQRNFSADGPDRVWVTDITEHPTGEGTLYCCAVKDLFSNRIVGCGISDRMTAPTRHRRPAVTTQTAS